ncbi:hypothetical protein HY486_04340 [Candidatus Woesearchaeota archaeon]|nr:hypothetical protein [Candidatus Woesearchaeota archaeon]
MSNDANRDIVTQLNLIRRLQKALNGSNEEEQTEAITAFFKQYDSFMKATMHSLHVSKYLQEECVSHIQDAFLEGAKNFQENRASPVHHLYFYALKGIAAAKRERISNGFTGSGLGPDSFVMYKIIRRVTKEFREKIGHLPNEEEIREEIRKDPKKSAQILSERKRPLQEIVMRFHTITTNNVEDIAEAEQGLQDDEDILSFNSYAPLKERRFLQQTDCVISSTNNRTGVEDLEIEETLQLVKSSFSKLTEREQIILAARFGTYDWLSKPQIEIIDRINKTKREQGKTFSLELLGNYFKLTRERIRQLQLKAEYDLFKIANIAPCSKEQKTRTHPSTVYASACLQRAEEIYEALKSPDTEYLVGVVLSEIKSGVTSKVISQILGRKYRAGNMGVGWAGACVERNLAREIRKSQKLTQVELAKQLGIEPAYAGTISFYENIYDDPIHSKAQKSKNFQRYYEWLIQHGYEP